MLEVFEGKKILLTGNAGFKGSCLTQVLLQKECKIFGFSDQIPTNPSLFEILALEEKIHQCWENVCEAKKLRKFILETKPHFIFHLAAQLLVLKSFLIRSKPFIPMLWERSICSTRFESMTRNASSYRLPATRLMKTKNGNGAIARATYLAARIRTVVPRLWLKSFSVPTSDHFIVISISALA